MSAAAPASWLAALGLMAALAGCADLRDVFTPYAPHPEEIEALASAPWPRPRFDVAVVLGCPADPDGDPSPCQYCRVEVAARQYRAGVVRKLILSGNAAHSAAVEAEVMAQLAIRRGVAPADVVREPRALTTWQNLRYSLGLMRAQGWSTALVVSTADHLPRARRIARFYGLDDAHAGYLACDKALIGKGTLRGFLKPPATSTAKQSSAALTRRADAAPAQR